jgi:muramidase (phage lysozyme)
VTPNLTAFLAMVAQCEVGTADKSGYNILYGGGRFDSFADHPRRKITAGAYTSTAAGRYQILAGTWDDFIKAEGPHDFSPGSQDLCARWLLNRRGATADIESGRLRAAITRCNKEWASLPGSPYGQPVRTLEYCERIFAQHGGAQIDGTTTYREPRPIPTEPRMGATLLAGLIPSILQLFSGRAQAAISKATGASPEVAAKFTADIARQIETVSGVPVTDAATAMQAAGAIASDPVKVAALESHATGFVLAEIGGGVVGAAEEYAAINRDLDDDTPVRIVLKFFFNMQNVVTLLLLAGVGYFVPPLAAKVGEMSAEAAMGLIVLIFAVIGVVTGRWLRLAPKEKE